MAVLEGEFGVGEGDEDFKVGVEGAEVAKEVEYVQGVVA